VSCGATGLELCGSRCIRFDSVRAEERVHVTFVLSRHDDRVDVLVHEEIGLDNCVGAGAAGRCCEEKSDGLHVEVIARRTEKEK